MKRSILKRLGRIVILLGVVVQQVYSQNKEKADAAYFRDKKSLLTAVWTSPFGYAEIESKHAPKGPFLGNGDVGVVSYTSEKGQTLLVSKVDFVTDDWSDWAGTGPATLPAGSIRIMVDAQPGTGFRYEMDQVDAELRMMTGTEEQVEMQTRRQTFPFRFQW